MEKSFSPVVTMCRDGRWLAVSPYDANIRVGVIGRDENEAREKFHSSVARWREILAGAANDQEGKTQIQLKTVRF